MKKIIKIFLFGLFVLFAFMKSSNAETFIEGNFITGEYINKVISGKTYYMTIQYIKDSNGNIVYCLEPFVEFESSGNYSKYEWDLSSYSKLSLTQRRRIELLTYYGYGYNGRTDSKWYAITQYLIWKTVDTSADIYFTNSLNGSKINKYADEIQKIENDIKNHDVKASFIHDYTLNYNEGLAITDLNDNYELVDNTVPYEFHDYFMINHLTKDGFIKLRRKSNYYRNKIALFVSNNSQDLIRPGNINNTIYTINFTVAKGNILLDIRDDDSVYSIDKNLGNTCYNILSNNSIFEKVCVSKETKYLSLDLPYGSYQIKQVSNGIGYKKDENIYNVNINSSNNKPSVILYNYLIKNKIEITKYYCKDKVCKLEKNAKFAIYDNKDNLVDYIVTDNSGYGNLVLGYGSYMVKQVASKDGYELVNSYEEKIYDEDSIHRKDLYDNYYVNEKEEIKEETLIDNSIQEEIVDDKEISDTEDYNEVTEEKKDCMDVEELPPDTNAKLNVYSIFKVILNKIKKYIICW